MRPINSPASGLPTRSTYNIAKRAIILLVLTATIALPFFLRPKKPAAVRADVTLVIITPNNEAIRYEFGDRKSVV